MNDPYNKTQYAVESEQAEHESVEVDALDDLDIRAIDNPILNSHISTVKLLFKKGEQMLPQITEFDLSLLHAAIGICGEAAELEKAVFAARCCPSPDKMTKEIKGRRNMFWRTVLLVLGLDRGNILEECGDHKFYDRALLVTLGIDIEEKHWEDSLPDWLLHLTLSDKKSLARLCNLVSAHTILAGDILDVIKKKVMYRKELDMAKLRPLLKDDAWVLSQILDWIDATDSDAMTHNIDKLLTGKKARYKEGYSDAAAQHRADKGGEQ